MFSHKDDFVMLEIANVWFMVLESVYVDCSADEKGEMKVYGKVKAIPGQVCANEKF